MSNGQTYPMRMARATEQDIDAVQKFWETVYGWAESDDRTDADSIQDAIDAVEGSFNRVFYGYQVLHDNACDKSLGYLDYSPKIKRFEQQRDQLLAVAESNLALIKSVYDLRLADGSLPFNTIDYYAIERVIADTETAIAAAKGEAQ